MAVIVLFRLNKIDELIACPILMAPVFITQIMNNTVTFFTKRNCPNSVEASFSLGIWFVFL